MCPPLHEHGSSALLLLLLLLLLLGTCTVVNVQSLLLRSRLA